MYIAVQAMHTSVELHYRVKIKEFIYLCAGMGDKNDSCLFMSLVQLQSFQDLMVMLKDELGVNKCLLYIL